MNPVLALSLLGLSTIPAAPVPKEPAPNPLSWSYMGVRVQNVVDGNDAPLQINAPEPGTPAYKAGLQIGDVLVKIGTIRPRNFEDVQRYIFGLRPGTTIAVVVRRGSELKTVKTPAPKNGNTPAKKVSKQTEANKHQPHYDLPIVDPEDERAEGKTETLKGKVSGRNVFGVAVEYGSDEKNGAFEIWSTFNNKTKLSGVKNFSELQEGDIVEIKYKRIEKSGKNILQGVTLLQRKPKEEDGALVIPEAPQPKMAKPGVVCLPSAVSVQTSISASFSPFSSYFRFTTPLQKMSWFG